METKYKRSSTIKNMKFIDSDDLYKKFVNPNSLLVKIHNTVDFSFVNDLCDDLYSKDGQHAYLPELVFKVSFIQFFSHGLSDNEVLKQCKVNLEYRYFCDLAIDDELFDDCKLSRFRKELGPERFKNIFDTIIEKIKHAGLIKDEDVQYLDSFLFLADVKIVSTNVLLSKAIHQALMVMGKKDKDIEEDTKKRDFELSEDEQKKRFVFLVQKAQEVLACAKQASPEEEKSLTLLRRIVRERAEIKDDGSVRKKEKEEEKDKIMSLSDTDARMMGKKKDDIHPTYKSHVSMNKNGFITSTDVTHSTTYDGHQAINAISELKSRRFTVPICVGDTHYGDIEFRRAMGQQMTQAIAPYRQNQIMNSCMTEDVMIEAWAFNHTEEYKEHMKIRAHIEPKQGEMKNLHGMKRAKLRGLKKVKIQNYLSAIVTNCKKFARNIAS